jgi:hypothetical protein
MSYTVSSDEIYKLMNCLHEAAREVIAESQWLRLKSSDLRYQVRQDRQPKKT